MAEVAHAGVDGLGCDAEQLGDGDLWQGQAVVEHDGQQPVGQGEDRAAAGGAVTFDAWSLASALLKSGFSLFVVQGQEPVDEFGPRFRGQAGDRGVGQPGKARSGRVESSRGWVRRTGRVCRRCGRTAPGATCSSSPRASPAFAPCVLLPSLLCAWADSVRGGTAES